MTRILITGVAGFLGSHIADAFIGKGYDVVGIDNLIGGYRENVPSKVKFHELDLDNLESIIPCFEGVNTVIHSACTAYEGLSVFSPSLVARNTSQISTNVFSAAIAAKTSKIIFLSSMARYGTQETLPFVESMSPKPQDPYGIAKYASELMLANLCQTHNLDFVTLVPHNIIGPRQKFDDPYRNVASIMINRMLMGKQPIIYGDGEQKRCFSFIQDVVNPILNACETEKALGKVINIGPDEEFVSINELAKIIASLLNFNLNPIYVAERPQEVLQASCSADLARELLNYKTSTNLRTGLSELVEWIKEKGPREFKYHLPLEIINQRTPKTWTEELI